jgi:hypothetical protein
MNLEEHPEILRKGKGKIVPVLLAEHNAMKTYWEMEV